jgi:hypothetical protein
LSVQEVAHGDIVVALVMDGSILEHLVDMRLRSNAHILLAKMLDVGVDVGTSKLLRKRDLLQRHLVDGCARRAKQRRCGQECALHDCDS